MSEGDPALPRDDDSLTEHPDDDNDTKTRKRKERLEQNRISARESRKRKKTMIEELQRTVITLSRENKELNERNEGLRRQLMEIGTKYPNVVPLHAIMGAPPPPDGQGMPGTDTSQAGAQPGAQAPAVAGAPGNGAPPPPTMQMAFPQMYNPAAMQAPPGWPQQQQPGQQQHQQPGQQQQVPQQQGQVVVNGGAPVPGQQGVAAPPGWGQQMQAAMQAQAQAQAQVQQQQQGVPQQAPTASQTKAV